MAEPVKPTEPDDPSKSGKFRSVTPHEAGKPVATKIGIEDSTREHTLTVEQVHADEVNPELPERRRQQSGTQVIMQQAPPAGGLLGRWANIANMSAVGLIMAVFVWILFSVRTDERERRSQEREDRINDRSQTQAAFAALTSSITTMANRSDARDTRMDAQAVRLDAFLEESRQARAEMKATQVEMLKVLRAILDKGKMEPEEATAAPMPRAKRAIGSG